MSERSVEQVMLDVVAYNDPIDYHSVKRRVGEELGREITFDRHREALSNLRDLGFVYRQMHHEYVHITETGWRRLGGDTSRHRVDLDPEVGPNDCPYCRRDEAVESRW